MSLNSVGSVWVEMEAGIDYGGSRRIDSEYPHDAFCTLDSRGRRGLLIIADVGPERTPIFDAMEIAVVSRSDSRVGLTITLRSTSLNDAFESLCDGLLAACEPLEAPVLQNGVVNYLVRANSLLEYGDPQILSSSALRGLLGELLILRELFEIVSKSVAVSAWVGPLKAAQDFVFPDRLIETKTKTAVSNAVTIASVDQLDPITPLPLTLAVVTISPLQDDLIDAISPSELVDEIRSELSNDSITMLDFDRRLRAANYFPRPFYSQIKFRLISMRFYSISASFPRLRRTDLTQGIVSASYELDLSVCDSFETLLEDPWN